MFKKQIAAVGAAILVATPAAANDIFRDQAPGMMFFLSIPLDAKTPKQQLPAYGLSFQGQHEFQRITVDSRMFEQADRMGFGPFAGLSAKWVVAGLVAGGAVIAVASKDKSTTNDYQQQQQQQAAAGGTGGSSGGGSGGGGGSTPCPATC
jgi:hypothetical protein